MIDEQKKLGCWSSRLVSSRLDNAPKVPITPMMQISEARPCPRGSSMPMYVRCGRMQKKVLEGRNPPRLYYVRHECVTFVVVLAVGSDRE